MNTNKTEDVVVHVDRTPMEKKTTLYLETIGFFTLHGFMTVFGDNCSHLPEDIRQCLKKSGCLTFFLGRYFSPHPTAFRRDAHQRPVCPGPLSLNHCLWKYAETTQFRQMLATKTGLPSYTFKKQKDMFGCSQEERLKTFENEKKAYLCIHLSSDIAGHVHMTREFNTNDMSLSVSNMWLETVTCLT